MDKIICIGKNYPDHARELGEAQPDKPVIFLKPPSVLKQATDWQQTIRARLPHDTEIVPECELVLEIGTAGENIQKDDALRFIKRIAVGLDMTLRGKQHELKKRGHPWTTAKVFADAAILSPWIDINALPDWQKTTFSLHRAGVCVQHATANDMLHSPAFLIHYVSQFFALCPGDIIFTGTPVGCIAIEAGTQVQLKLGDKN
jgi:2-keto-4-pentenoate hydratase/2-oxohepta-3-ene-1,7-dioic acid hydratase in catechol pathway